MAVTVRRLLEQSAQPSPSSISGGSTSGSALGLRLVAGDQGLDRALTWVTVSELADPTPYLEGGELVLLTGIGLELDGPQAGAYVDRLVARGVAAMGLGVGIRFEQVPQPLLVAATAAGLPLLEVDRPTPFVAVSRAVAELLGAEESERARRRLDGMRALTADVARGGDPMPAVRRLAALVEGWVVLCGSRGEVLVQSAGADAQAAAAVVERIRGRGTRVSASVSEGSSRVVAVPLGVSGRPAGYLAVGGAAERDPDHQLVAFAAALLTLDRERARGASATTRWARAVALTKAVGLDDAAHLACAQPPPTVLDLVLAAGPVRVVAVPGVTAAAVLDALDDDDRVLAADLPALSPRTQEGVCLLVTADDDLDDVLVAAATAASLSTTGGSEPLRAGVSDPVDVSGAGDRSALAAATATALSLAERSRSGILRAQDAPPTLVALLGDHATGAFARAVLEPLQTLDDGERAVLEQTLAVWLRGNGEVGVAAGTLGVHRHTLRQRLRRAEQILQRDLDDPQTRVDLWVALTARPAPGNPS